MSATTKEYFSHDYGTRNKTLMAALLHEQKARGYGLFWIIVEMLHEGSMKWMDLGELSYIAISKESGEPVDFIEEFVGKCIHRYKVFKQEENRFTTDRVLRNIDMRLELSASRSVAGKKGAMAKWQNHGDANGKDGKDMAKPLASLANDGKGKESKGKESKRYLRPKGLTASFEADPAEIRAMKTEYDTLVTSLEGSDNTQCWKTIKTFVSDRKPQFIEPFIDLWNVFALTHRLIKLPIRVTDHRRKKLETRVREPGFDFVAVLQAIKKSPFLQGKNDRGWKVDFEFIVNSEENYTKIVEEKYQ